MSSSPFSWSAAINFLLNLISSKEHFNQRCNLDLDLDLYLADLDGLTSISISTSISEILIKVEVGPNRKILQWKSLLHLRNWNNSLLFFYKK